MRIQRRGGLFLALIAVALAVTAVSVIAAPASAQGSTLDEMDGTGTENDPYVITNAEQLQAMNQDLDAHYVLGNDVDASDTESWNARSGFEPVGGYGDEFGGSFDGRDHTITGLTIDRPTEDFVGLFGHTSGSAEIANVTVEATSVRGNEVVGALVGSSHGTVVGTTTTGSVRGSRTVGGLVGFKQYQTEVRDAGSSATVRGDSEVGGLAGATDGIVFRTYATGDVSGTEEVGGLAGSSSGEVRNSYATGDVSGSEEVGGLVGSGGDTEGVVMSSYATGDVSGTKHVGGLIGWNPGTASAVFATGSVRGDTNVGGLVGERGQDKANYDPQLIDAYWDRQTSDRSEPIGRVGSQTNNIDTTGLETIEMSGDDATSNLDRLAFGDVFTTSDEYPIFQWQVEDVSVSLDDETVAEGQHTDATVTLSLTDGTTVTASEVADYDADASIATVDAGTLTAESEGETEITATVAGQSDSATLDVLEPPEISQTGAGLDAEGVVNGSTATITATYENTGGMAGGHTADLAVDGESAATERATVGLDGETTVTFEFTPEETGEYDVAVDGNSEGTLTVVERGTVSVTGVSAPEQVGESTPYEVDIELANDADVAVVDTVAYSVDGETVASKSVAVDAGSSTATFEHAVDGTGTVEHRIDVRNTNATATSEVVDPPEFVVNDVDVPETAETGDAVEITATVENAGGLEHTRPVTVQFGGENATTADVTLAPGESTEVVADVTPEASGDVEYAVDTGDANQSGSLSVEGGESEPSSAEDGQSDSDDGSPGFGVVAALAALSLVAVSRRR